VLNEPQAPRVRGEGRAEEAAAGREHNRAIKGNSEYETYSLVFPNWYAHS